MSVLMCLSVKVRLIVRYYVYQRYIYTRPYIFGSLSHFDERKSRLSGNYCTNLTCEL